MPVQKRSRIASFALHTLTSAVIGTALLSPAVHAAGLGKLTVLSSLGQPLRAEIELTAVTAEESGDLTARLAPAEAFRAANIDFNPALLNLRFDIEQRNGRQFIRVTSSQPINEPFVDMLLELTWAKGRLVREYTFLLDPAELRNTQSPQVAAPVDVSRGAQEPVRQAPPAATPVPPASSAPTAQQRREEQDRADVEVRRGDTLSEIASELKPAGVSLDMMLVALYRANPEAFSGKNMNRLKSGSILSVPGADVVRGTSQREARGVVVAHAADFNAYRNRLAGQVAASTPAKAPETGQSATGKITAKVEERPTAVNEAKDQLKLSKAGEGSGKVGKAPAIEDKLAKDQQVADAAARVKELEKNVSDLEKLMTVKTDGGADAQSKANAAAVAQADKAAAPQPMAPVDLTATTQPTQPTPTAPNPAAKPAAPPVVMPPAQPGIMDSITENLPIIGVTLAALLAAAGLMLSRRRKAREKVVIAKTVPAPLADTAPAQPLFAEAGGQSVDTSNSVFNSNFAPSASQLDTNEVDPIAEADVYIAYGRDLQAEEILKEALRTHPERHAVRLKLLEIYANRKDTRAFEAQANELHAATRGHGEEWTQAAALGRSIDPANPLYGDGGAPAPGSYAAAAAVAGVAAAGGIAAYAADAQGNGRDDEADAARLSDYSANYGAPARAPAEEGGLDLDLGTAAPDYRAPGSAVEQDFDFDQDATALPATEASAPADTNLMDFDFGDERPATPPAAPAAAADADAEHFLDFDLGGLGEPPAAPAPQPPEDAAPAHLDLAFDSDEPATAPAPATAPPSSLDELGMDFDLDLPGTDKPAPAPAASGTADPLAELDLMDFDLPASVPPGQAAATPAQEPSLGLDEQDFGLPELPREDAAPTAPPPEFDLSGIDLDLDETAQPQASAPAEPAPDPYAVSSAAALHNPIDEPMSAMQMEMDTKLDLATAYQEIGDKEGARELLDEVIRGGSDDQVARANQMLAQLG
ncbi:FimV/HubP family polar landmark protein [Pseudoduganella buxea]|uniref:Motility protein FimV n=1 Tax=Pseudoduganella buxea TaxID=1949069 RepID=A0A6I3SWW7_9BURK|nr:FimV/HubP family polar landmark protein [Pseudoduganella buxea]MTV52752.1 pilus assembly protein FimV [Pseudoduganella buxea]GGB85361.1 motility protein FimV [Pseudoduganella buxea]